MDTINAIRSAPYLVASLLLFALAFLAMPLGPFALLILVASASMASKAARVAEGRA